MFGVQLTCLAHKLDVWRAIKLFGLLLICWSTINLFELQSNYNQIKESIELTFKDSAYH